MLTILHLKLRNLILKDLGTLSHLELCLLLLLLLLFDFFLQLLALRLLLMIFFLQFFDLLFLTLYILLLLVNNLDNLRILVLLSFNTRPKRNHGALVF